MIDTQTHLSILLTGPDIAKFETELYWSLRQKRVNKWLDFTYTNMHVKGYSKTSVKAD